MKKQHWEPGKLSRSSDIRDVRIAMVQVLPKDTSCKNVKTVKAEASKSEGALVSWFIQHANPAKVEGL